MIRVLFVSLSFSLLFGAPVLSDSTVSNSHLPKLFHHPPNVLFDNRLFDIELIVDFPLDSIESVSLFFKTDAMDETREIPLEYVKGKFVYRFNPTTCQCTSLQYFFIVQLTDYSLYSFPMDNQKELKPIERDLTNAVEYYELQWMKNDHSN